MFHIAPAHNQKRFEGFIGRSDSGISPIPRSSRLNAEYSSFVGAASNAEPGAGCPPPCGLRTSVIQDSLRNGHRRVLRCTPMGNFKENAYAWLTVTSRVVGPWTDPAPAHSINGVPPRLADFADVDPAGSTRSNRCGRGG